MGEEDESGEEGGHRGMPNGLDPVRTSTVEGVESVSIIEKK
jgi:hypothetical protein